MGKGSLGKSRYDAVKLNRSRSTLCANAEAKDREVHRISTSFFMRIGFWLTNCCNNKLTNPGLKNCFPQQLLRQKCESWNAVKPCVQINRY